MIKKANIAAKQSPETANKHLKLFSHKVVVRSMAAGRQCKRSQRKSNYSIWQHTCIFRRIVIWSTDRVRFKQFKQSTCREGEGVHVAMILLKLTKSNNRRSSPMQLHSFFVFCLAAKTTSFFFSKTTNRFYDNICYDLLRLQKKWRNIQEKNNRDSQSTAG